MARNVPRSAVHCQRRFNPASIGLRAIDGEVLTEDLQVVAVVTADRNRNAMLRSAMNVSAAADYLPGSKL